jgi:polysaccharide export outer membrane protein
MKILNLRAVRFGLLLFPAAAVLCLGAGCDSTDVYKKAMIPPGGMMHSIVPQLSINDSVTITFSGLPDADTLPPQVEKPIKEDGTISLPYIGPVQAAGKTAGELEDNIRNLYVPAYYTHLNVTVKTGSDQVYFVRGEVKSPGRLMYVGTITVTKAITSAGDFTDYANHHRVFLIRSNGQHFKLDCDKILSGEEPDPPVLPGDQVQVDRRIF